MGPSRPLYCGPLGPPFNARAVSITLFLQSSSFSFSSNSAECCCRPHSRTAAMAKEEDGRRGRRRSNLVKRSNKKVESSAPLLSGLPSAAGRPAGRLGPGPLGLHGCQGRRTGDGTRTMTSLGSGRTKEDADGGAWRRKWQIRYSGRSSKRELRFIMRWIARVEKKGRGS